MATAETRTYSTGKRKTAIARVWIKAGTGAVSVNGKTAEEYFERETSRMIMRQALELIEAVDQFDVTATVHGGGHSAQAEAMRHGISRALTLYEPDLRGILKVAGFLTRDSRVVERKKYGKAKARRSFQFSKR